MDPQYADPQFMEESSFNIKDLPGILLRRKWSLILPAVVISILGVLIAMLLPPVFKSTSTILIEEQEIPQDFVMATVTSFAEQRLQTINQRIMSTTKLLEIINRFDLYQKMREKKTTEEVVDKMRSDVKLRQISAEVVDRRTGRPTAATIAFSLSYEGKDTPQRVQQVANVLASLFLEENLKVRERQTRETYDFLELETARVREEMQRIDAKLSRFKEEHINELPELLQMNIQALENTERNIERLLEQTRSLREREGYLESQLATLSPFMENRDRDRLNELRVQLVYLETRFTDAYPDVIKTREEIGALEKKLAAEGDPQDQALERPDNPAYVTLQSQLASTRADIESVKRQEKDFREKADLYRRRIENTPRVEEAYSALMAERASTQMKFNDLLQKTMEAKVAQGLEKEQKGERFTLIDPARLPEKPFKPNRMAIIIVGVVLGLAAGGGLVALREMSDKTVRKPDELALAADLPLLGTLPEIITRQDRWQRRRKRLIWVASGVTAVVVGIAVFHFFIMDLDIFWIKVLRRVDGGVL